MLKGKATIELTNVKTGEVEVYEEENMITNAVQDILSMNPFLIKNTYNSYWWQRDTIFPLCPRLFGGVLLYKDPLNEDPDDYYASYENELVGYSSNNVNTTVDTMRGSMNQTESGPINNNKGYKFVFDFSTSQANAKISSLGLTSFWGGMEGYGSSQQGGVYRIRNSNQLTPQLTTNLDKKAITNLCLIDYENNYGICVYKSAINTITLRKYLMTFSQIGINEMYPVGKALDTYTINTSIFGSTTSYYFSFYCDENKTIWGFDQRNRSGNSSGNAILDWIKINPQTLEFEEGTWELPIQINQIGYDRSAESLGSSHYKINQSMVYKNRFFCFSYDKTIIYSINIDDCTDIKIYRFSDGSSMYPTLYSYRSGYSAFNILGNVIIFPGGYIENDKVHKGNLLASTDAYGLTETATPFLKYGPFLFTVYKNSYSDTNSPAIKATLMTPYLATINNLETPIEKTEDKTMKITYILTEVDDGEEE